MSTAQQLSLPIMCRYGHLQSEHAERDGRPGYCVMPGCRCLRWRLPVPERAAMTTESGGGLHLARARFGTPPVPNSPPGKF